MIEQLFGDNVLLKPIEEEKVTSGGIIIPDSVDNIKITSKGIVVMTGEGVHDQNTGEFKPIKVKKGDIVLYDSGCSIWKDKEWEGLYLINERDIITAIN